MIQQKQEHIIKTPSNLPAIQSILNQTSLDPIEKKNITSFCQYFSKQNDPLLASRSLILYGSPGVGKTFLSTQLLKKIHTQIHYIAPSTHCFNHAKKYESLKTLLPAIQNNQQQLIFLDDLPYFLHRNDFSEIKSSEKQRFMQLLEEINTNPNKLLLITLNNMGFFDEQMMDRIDMHIHIDVPSITQKHLFLKQRYQKHLTKKQQQLIAEQSIGYNFRDLPEMIKLSYRLGDQQISTSSLQNAMKHYQPTRLYGFIVENPENKGFHDVIGKPKAICYLQALSHHYQHQQQATNLQIQRHNLLLFHGPPGTGKTFMARAFAGELGFPIVHINSHRFHGRNPFHGVQLISGLAKRFQRCIIFVDEAEKIMGNPRHGEDNPVLAELHQELDGIDTTPLQAILIFAVNELQRFSPTLLDRFTLIDFQLPDYQERKQFFSRKKKHLTEQFIKKPDPKKLALQTQGMSFRDLDRVWNKQIISHLHPENKTLIQHSMIPQHLDMMFQ